MSYISKNINTKILHLYMNNNPCKFTTLTDLCNCNLSPLIRHRWTGRYEAHLWDNSIKKEGQARKGKQGKKN